MLALTISRRTLLRHALSQLSYFGKDPKSCGLISPSSNFVAVPSIQEKTQTAPVTPLQHQHQHSNLQILSLGNYDEGGSESSSLSDTNTMLECSLYAWPKKMHSQFLEVFSLAAPFCSSSSQVADVKILLICQRTENDMSSWSNSVFEEREFLLEKFVNMSQILCTTLTARGHWADFIDPSSGKPYYSPQTNHTLNETDECYTAFGLEILDVGCCKVLYHKTWGTHVYVCSIFTTAPMDVVQKLLGTST